MNLKVNGHFPPDTHDEISRYPSSNPMSIIGEIYRMINMRIVEGEEKNSLFQKSPRLIMMELSRREGVTQLDLARSTHLKAPTISITLQKLEKAGYVERTHDDYDLRAVRVYLTEKGRSYNRYIIKKVLKEEERALECLSDSENKQLHRLLLKIRENLVEDSEKNLF
jgi:DNA-binding MarR family transcriptional regulator